MIEVNQVTMRFRMVNDKVMSLKEYAVAFLKRRLQYKTFTAFCVGLRKKKIFTIEFLLCDSHGALFLYFLGF